MIKTIKIKNKSLFKHYAFPVNNYLKINHIVYIAVKYMMIIQTMANNG